MGNAKGKMARKSVGNPRVDGVAGGVDHGDDSKGTQENIVHAGGLVGVGLVMEHGRKDVCQWDACINRNR